MTLTDTVGFIDNLSAELNDSFLTTLDEIRFADMLLIVIDASHNIDHQIEAIETAIKGIEVSDKEILYVFNKMDTVENDLAVKLYKREENRIYISAHNDDDLVRLKDEIVSIIKSDYEKVSMHVPFADGDVLDYMMTNYDILTTEYDPDGTNIEFEISKEDKSKYARFINSL